MKKTVSMILLILLLTSTLTLAFNPSFVKAGTDPIITGVVRDKLGNPIPNVLIVAQDVSTELDVASATSNATGAYAMSVPPSMYNLIVTPPPESGFAPTTISNVEVTEDTVMDIVLVPAETVVFSGLVVDRDGNPVSSISVYLYSGDIWIYASTNETGLFSMFVSPGSYNLRIYGGFGLAIADLYKSSPLNLTENTFITIALQNRYLSGKVIGPEGNSIPDVSIFIRGSTSFDDFSGYFEKWTTSDSEGNFNITVYISSGVSIRASPPPESAFAPVSITNVNVTEDASITIILPHAIAFGGLVVDRDGNPVSSISVYLYSGDIWIYASTNETGLFSMFVSPGSYNLRIYGGFGLAIADLYKVTALNITEDTFITITLQNRYFSGKVVDPEGHPVPNVSIFMRGSTTFDDFSGYFEKWTTSDSEGNFNITIYTSSNVALKATPPAETPFAPISITNINATEDTFITVTFPHAIAFGGLVVDRDGNPVSSISVYLYSGDIWIYASTNETGLFSMFVSPGSYNLRIYGGFGLAIADLYKVTALNITEDTFITITLQNRYLTGKVDCEGKPVPNVSIFIRGSTSFDDFSGYFEKWTTSDSEGNFNVTIYTSSSVSLRATPPPESIYAPVSITNIDVTDDKMVLIALSYKAGVLPIANFTWTPETPEVGQTVTFDASTSIPGSGIIIRHKWSFGDGTYALGKTPTHTYASSGTYTVTLNVTNSKGLSDIEQKQIQVVEPGPGPKPPVASFTFSPANPKVDEKVTFDASASFDPDGEIVSFNWDFGDVVYGIDVRDDINWTEIYNAGYRFAFVKATEGINWSKPGFEKRVEDAQKAGLLVGVYHFGRPVPNKDKAKEEAESFIRLAGDYLQEGYLRPALDVEDSDYYGEYPEQLGKETLAQWIKTWMDTVEDMTGVEPILYMNGYLFQFLSDSSIADQYDIWVPDLRDAEPSRDDSPNTRGWNTWAFWQYKLNVALAGGTADLDVFNGDISKLQTFVIGGEEVNAKIVTHSYSKEGNYKVTLTVVDNDGKSNSMSKTVTVVKATPTANRLKILDKYYNILDQSTGWTESSSFYYLNYDPDGKKLPRSSETTSGFTTVDDGDIYPSQCVDFVRVLSNTRQIQTKYWKQGPNVMTSTDIEPGTVIATFVNGRYPSEGGGHVAVFAGFEYSDGKRIGFRVFDQNWRNDSGLGVVGKHFIYTWGSGVSDADNYYIVTLEGISIKATCPVDLVVIDPEYLVVSKEYSEVPDALYIEEDFNGDGSPDDYVFIPERKIGEYLITVIPEPGADPAATYSLEVSSEETTLLLAENVPISDIPTEPYILDSTTFEIPAFVTATIDIDPNALNLRSKGKWITAYIELPEGYDVSNINVSTVMLNGTVSAELKPVTIGDYDNDIIPDLMVKFDRAAVQAYILANVNMTELIEEGFMTVTLTITGYLNDGTPFQGSDTVKIIMHTSMCHGRAWPV